MPLDNSNTQSFRTHRLKCKAAAATPGPITNEQTTPESSFVDYKLGKMPYVVQPNAGPVTTDAGCCGSECDVLCITCLAARYIPTTVYSTLITSLGPAPLPAGYNYQYVGIVIFKSCEQTFDIQQLKDKDSQSIVNFSSPITIARNIDLSGVFSTLTFPCDVLTVPFAQDSTPGGNNASFIVTGMVHPCNTAILN